MKVLIMGCGRVGSRVASMLDAEGHDVTVMDLDRYSFRRLPPSFGGRALVGNGLDEDLLKRAGIEEADAFIALTQGDNRNVMASQIAKHIFQVSKVICRINDPIREEFYRGLGMKTYSPTVVGEQAVRSILYEGS